MGLPLIEHDLGSVELSDGSRVEFRGLSRAEAIELEAYKDDELELETRLLTKAVEGVDRKAAQQWIADTPSADVAALVIAILAHSGMTQEAGKG